MTELITAEQHAYLRHKIDAFRAARERFDPKRFKRGGGYTPEEYAAIAKLAGIDRNATNDETAQVELYEFATATELPQAIGGYVSSGDGVTMTGWTGVALPGVGTLRNTHAERLHNNPYSTHRYSYEATYKGRRYSGRGYGKGMYLVLKLRKR